MDRCFIEEQIKILEKIVFKLHCEIERFDSNNMYHSKRYLEHLKQIEHSIN